MKNKLNIEEIKQLIPDYITGSLSEEESSVVKNAIDNSDELKELYADMKNVFEFTDSVKFEEPQPQYWNNLLPRIHQKIEERNQQSLAKNPLSYIWKILVPVAAVLLIFIIYRISYNPAPEITQKEENKFQKENISPLQSKEKIEPVITKNKSFRRNKSNIKKTNIEQRNNSGNENIAQTDVIEYEQNGDIASIAIDELSIFGAGAPGILDDELDDELEKLNDTDREAFLEELKNNL